MKRKGAEEARKQLPELLDAAEKGESTVITRHGRPVAAQFTPTRLSPMTAISRGCSRCA
jgi:antitoxin (DNA-binding transcriptional repressor) of toxin-antitoxin stability system